MSQFDTKLAGYRRVELRWGETLQRLAERELGDAARWVDIANLNGLHPPYATGDAVEASLKVVLYGALLLVPAASIMASASIDPDLVFERDVALSNGALAADGGDFALCGGVANLTQALRHCVTTEKSELLFHPNYGCDVGRIKGETNSPVADLLAAAYVSSALKGDSRVKRLHTITATSVGDQLRVDAEIIPIDERRLSFGGYF